MRAQDDFTFHPPGANEDHAASRFNLSAWAVAHRPLALFFVIALALGGALAYLRLGRAEDPNFTIKVANVTAVWPGATSREMQDQVADPVEKKLQELAYLRSGPHLCDAGLHGAAALLPRRHAARERARALLPAAQEAQRHQAGSAGGSRRAERQ